MKSEQNMMWLTLLLCSVPDVLSAAISGLGCDQGRTFFLTPGVEYIVSCFVNNSGATINLIQWSISGVDLALLSTNAEIANGELVARRISAVDDTLNSSLTFTASQSLDEGTIGCQDNQNPPNADTCTLFVCTVPSIPIDLTVNSITYQSVNLSWTTPTDTGGCDSSVSNYIITVTPLNDNISPWNITTDDSSTTYNVMDNVTFRQSYNFTVAAENSIGVGEFSNTVTVTLPGELVPDPVAAIDVCLRYNVSGSFLNILWNDSCPSGTPATETTPPVIEYIISINGSNSTEVDPCNKTCQVTVPLNDAEGDHTINVTVRNMVGINDTVVRFDSRWLQEVTHTINYSISEATVYITTVSCLQTSKDLSIQLTYNNGSSHFLVTTKPYIANATLSFALTSLQPGTTIFYVLQLVGVSSVPAVGFFVTPSNVTSITSSGIIIPTPMTSAVPSITISTDCTVSSTASAVVTTVAVAVPISILTAIIAAVLSSVITYCCCVKSKGSHSFTSGSAVAAGDYETPVSVSTSAAATGVMELKDNMAYGQVTATAPTAVVYETVHN